MFVKPFKQKSNNTLKNSEKKNLIQRIQEQFTAASEEKVKEILTVKSNTTCLKWVLHSEEQVGVYVVDGVPMILDVAGELVPTVCALWRVPDLIPRLSIHSPVLSKMATGVPLYLPGVVIPTGGVGFPLFRKGTLVYCCTQDNGAAAVVGRTTMSSADMLLRVGGVCLDTIQVVGDLLCKEAPKSAKIERPQMSPPTYISSDNIAIDLSKLNLQPIIKEEWPSLGPGPVRAPQAAAVTQNVPKVIPEDKNSAAESPAIDEAGDTSAIDESQEDDIPTDMDGLLKWCLLSFIKLEGKNIELPLMTNLLYKNHLIPLCPSDRTLDVKKSSYKKMGKFLDAMQQEGLIEVREIDKGVSALTAVSASHPSVRAHVTAAASRPAPRPAPRAADDVDYVPPALREVYCVTAAVGELLRDVKKGTALTSAEIRAALTDYVKTRNLNSHKGGVTLDSALAKVVGKKEQESIKWEALMNGVTSRMTAATLVETSAGSKLIKSRLDPVTMQVATRSGNKKITLVSNLEQFGFSLSELTRVCQHGVAASCGVTRSPGAKADQLMIQGDQTHFVAKLLIDKYGLPKKYLEGADKALNKKK